MSFYMEDSDEEEDSGNVRDSDEIGEDLKSELLYERGQMIDPEKGGLLNCNDCEDTIEVFGPQWKKFKNDRVDEFDMDVDGFTCALCVHAKTPVLTRISTEYTLICLMMYHGYTGAERPRNENGIVHIICNGECNLLHSVSASENPHPLNYRVSKWKCSDCKKSA